MALSTRSRVAIAGLAVIAIAAVLAVGFEFMHRKPPSTPGHWPADQRSAFIDSCNKNCRNSPGVTPDRYPLCDTACTCAADEGEKILSSEDLAEIYLAQSGGKATREQSEKMQTLSRVALSCVTGALANQK